MQNPECLHQLTHMAINDLKNAFQECRCVNSGGLILSVMVSIKAIHDQLSNHDMLNPDIDPEEYCCAV